MVSFAHPIIGQIAGREVDACTQFLGVKYAALRNRFAHAELVRYDGSGIDATRFGPQVVSPEQGVDMEFGLIQQFLPKPDFPGISDVNGLNLNITIPGRANTIVTQRNLLPVLVFIHGGGFGIGGNWWPQYDFARLVKLSSDLGKPMIGVNINYRLGVPGFLTSPELRAAGYKANNSLRDQRVALRWIQDNIFGFGGDPDNVTVLGESAGAVSTGYLLLSDEKLAKRLVCLGGCPPLLGSVLPLEVADHAAQSAVAALGLKYASPSELVDRLLDVPVQDLFAKMSPAIPLLPTVDGDVISKQFSYHSFAEETTQMPGRQWIESILMVYSELDASIMGSMNLSHRSEGIAAKFRESAAKSLDDFPEALASLLDHYSLSLAATDRIEDNAALLRILALINDVTFFLPAINMATKYPKDSFVMAFNEPNPWDGPFKGHATHILDVAFLFQNFNGRLSQIQRDTAVAFGTDIIGYVSGENPGKAFGRGDKGAIGIYANGKRQDAADGQELNARRAFLHDLAHGEKGPGLDKVVRVVSEFLVG
ncbi:Alpha/Beta hydrolase protein [Podospora didyma]|uniref:Carboxylic ester hydrolase n=1 Tax=Podospora didyma TaxID=330526 RepID=A0AAE0NGI3_9PEZI|nr:Alpha/Beta hydrolase protein [Podospora didyma]